MVADRIEALLADEGYDADAILKEIAKAEIEAVIPAKSNRSGEADRGRIRGSPPALR